MQQIQLKNIVKTQFQYKMRAHISLLSTLVLYQVIFIILGIFLSSVMFGSGNGIVSIDINVYSANIVISITMIWSFIAGVFLTRKSSKLTMNIFVVDKQSNHLANGLLILFISAFAGVTAFLSHFVIASGVLFIQGDNTFQSIEVLTFKEVCLGIIITVLYVLLVCVIGYLIGEFAQLSKGLTIAVIVLCVFGSNIYEIAVLYGKISSFYLLEINIILFSVKILITTIVLFIIAMFVGKRLEVR